MQKQVNPALVVPDMPKILIIEDDKDLAEIMQEFFHMLGYNYYITGGLCDILPVIKEYQPDLVILDYLLPGTTGGELCSQIRKNIPTSPLPVILYSAYPQEMCVVDEGSYDEFVAKPFDLNELQQIVEKFILTSKYSKL
jgi:CheY-like chemotaxis protein